MNLLQRTQRIRDRKETSDLTHETKRVARDNTRIFSALLDVSKNKKELYNALMVDSGQLDKRVQPARERAAALAEAMEAITPVWIYADIEKKVEQLERLAARGEPVSERTRDLIHQGVYDYNLMRGRVSDAIDALSPAQESVDMAQTSGRVRSWLGSIFRKKVDATSVSDELKELKKKVSMAEKALGQLSAALGMDEARREEVRQNPKLQLAYNA